MEQRLIERAKVGDLDAFDGLVERHQGIAFRAAFMTLGNADEAEDVVQEAFVKAYLNLDRFEPGAAFRPWLLRIVTNEALNSKRASRRQANLRLRTGGRTYDRLKSELPEDAMIDSETQATLVDAINQLPARDRALIAYRYFLDLSPNEIAEIWDSPASTVRTQLSRALQKMRNQLGVHRDFSSTEASGVCKDGS